MFVNLNGENKYVTQAENFVPMNQTMEFSLLKLETFDSSASLQAVIIAIVVTFL